MASEGNSKYSSNKTNATFGDQKGSSEGFIPLSNDQPPLYPGGNYPPGGTGYPSSGGSGYPSSGGPGYPSSGGPGYPSSGGPGYPSSGGPGYPVYDLDYPASGLTGYPTAPSTLAIHTTTTPGKKEDTAGTILMVWGIINCLFCAWICAVEALRNAKQVRHVAPEVKAKYVKEALIWNIVSMCTGVIVWIVLVLIINYTTYPLF